MCSLCRNRLLRCAPARREPSSVHKVSYEVETPVFAGPFDLLLHLILQDEVDLYEVSLGTIIDVYLTEISKMEDLDLQIATEFLLIAATLVELKSRRLLPDSSDVDLDDELALWEERDLLLARLLECKTFKDASAALEAIAYDAAQSFPRTAGMDEQFLDLVPDLLDGVTAVDILAAFKRAAAPKPKLTIDLFHVTPVKLTVAETVGVLIDELRDTGRTTLRDLTNSVADRIEVVIYFLAVLELYKQGLVDLTQIRTFGDLTIEWVGGDADSDTTVIDMYEG
jgi:segregation and condensation protein A